LVVAEHHVELGPVLLDEVVLERQCFAFVAYYNSFEIGDLPRQRTCLGVNPARFQEVRSDTAAQVARLANVKHRPAGILEEIHARTFRKLRGFFAGFHGNSWQLSVISYQFSVKKTKFKICTRSLRIRAVG